MPVSKKNSNPVAMSQRERKYSTGQLLKSRALSGYQPDFVKVILTEPEYTIEEARAVLESALKGGR